MARILFNTKDETRILFKAKILLVNLVKTFIHFTYLQIVVSIYIYSNVNMLYIFTLLYIDYEIWK